MGAAASLLGLSSASSTPYVVSNVDKKRRYISLNDGKLDLSELDLAELPGAVKALGPRVEDIALDRNSLVEVSTQAFAETFEGLTGLKRINLDSNRLVAAPEVLFSLPHVEQIVLTNNALKELPSGVRGLGTTLLELNLERNFLSTLPDSIGELKVLRLLSASRNWLDELPDAIGQLSALNTLWIEHNRLSDVPDALCLCSALEDLNLHDNRLSTLPEGLDQLTALKWLSLGKNRFSQLPQAVFKLPKLETLHLQLNNLRTLPEPSRKPVTEAVAAVAAAAREHDPLAACKDALLSNGFSTIQAASEAVDTDPSSTSTAPPSSSSRSASGDANGGPIICSALKVVWLSGNPLCQSSTPPPCLRLLPHIEECRMKSDTHGRPVRSNSFDLGNWAAAAGGLETIQGFSHLRRGSFKKDHTQPLIREDGSTTSPTPPQMRQMPRKVSFSGQLPGLPASPDRRSEGDRNTDMSGPSSSASSSPKSQRSSKDTSPTLPLRIEKPAVVRGVGVAD